jgi:hypothetical protein
MTRTEFLHKVALAFAANNSLPKEDFSPEYYTTLICNLSEQLTNKVAEKAEFDIEFGLQ